MADPLKVRVGRDLAWSFGPLVNEAGEPLNMSGASTGEWYVLTNEGDPTSAVLHLTSTLGSILFVPNEINGQTQYTMLLVIEPEDTVDVPPGLYFHEPIVVDSTGHIYTLETADGNLIQFERAVPLAA